MKSILIILRVILLFIINIIVLINIEQI